VAYTVRVLPAVARRIASWGLSDPVLVEVYLRLEALRNTPADHLRRERRPFDGMVWRFNLIDPDNRIQQHFFCFQVLYGQDEQTLMVARGAYIRTVGV
jgi:hypothetical protein